MGNKTLLITLVLGFGLGILLSAWDTSTPTATPTRTEKTTAQTPGEPTVPTQVTRAGASPGFVEEAPADLPPLDWARTFPNAESLWSREKKVAQGVRQEQLLRTRYKFPLVRIESDVGPGGQTQTRAAYIGDHLLVRLRKGVRVEDLQPFLDEHTLSVRRRLAGGRMVAVSFESAEEPTRFAEVQELLRSRQDLFESVDRDEIAVRDAAAP